MSVATRGSLRVNTHRDGLGLVPSVVVTSIHLGSVLMPPERDPLSRETTGVFVMFAQVRSHRFGGLFSFNAVPAVKTCHQRMTIVTSGHQTQHEVLGIHLEVSI